MKTFQILNCVKHPVLLLLAFFATFLGGANSTIAPRASQSVAATQKHDGTVNADFFVLSNPLGQSCIDDATIGGQNTPRTGTLHIGGNSAPRSFSSYSQSEFSDNFDIGGNGNAKPKPGGSSFLTADIGGQSAPRVPLRGSRNAPRLDSKFQNVLSSADIGGNEKPKTGLPEKIRNQFISSPSVLFMVADIGGSQAVPRNLRIGGLGNPPRPSDIGGNLYREFNQSVPCQI